MARFGLPIRFLLICFDFDLGVARYLVLVDEV